MYPIENRMADDAQWRWQEHRSVEEIMKEPGYHEMGTNVFVPADEAFEYALDRCINGPEEDQKEFKKMLVEWFYSGNWTRED